MLIYEKIGTGTVFSLQYAIRTKNEQFLLIIIKLPTGYWTWFKWEFHQKFNWDTHASGVLSKSLVVKLYQLSCQLFLILRRIEAFILANTDVNVKCKFMVLLFDLGAYHSIAPHFIEWEIIKLQDKLVV